MTHPGRWVRRRLHRRLFFWFGAAIVLTMAAGALAAKLVGAGSGWRDDVRRVQRFASVQFEEVWSNERARNDRARILHETLNARVILEDPAGSELLRLGEDCHGGEFVAPITRGPTALGTLRLCRLDPPGGGGHFVFGLLAAAATLWGLSMIVARRLVRPLRDLARVTRDIGAGNLSSRVRLGRHAPGEVGELADSINQMAERIESQIEDQRELLAGVSHEIRTPLARLRVLVEIMRDAGADAKNLEGIEREVMDIDELVGQLLASSRLDFSALERRKLQAHDVATRALERAGVRLDVLDDSTDGASFEADPTLVGRALANLLENAQKHGGGVEAFRVSTEDGRVRFAIEDGGSGFPDDLLSRAFDKFVRDDRNGAASTSLGLGLALVQRIAEAHGGRARAENRPEGGACVTIELQR